MILHYSHFENAVCIWPLASCFKTYPWQLCPTCESWVPAAGGFSSSSCLLDWCCTSCNPFWHQRTTYPPSRLHTLSGHDPQVCVSRSRIWKDIAAVEGWVSVNSVGCSSSQSVFCMLHTPRICSWRHFCCHTKQRMTRHQEWMPMLGATSVSNSQDRASTSEILSQYVRQKQGHAANSTLFS